MKKLTTIMLMLLITKSVFAGQAIMPTAAIEAPADSIAVCTLVNKQLDFSTISCDITSI